MPMLKGNIQKALYVQNKLHQYESEEEYWVDAWSTGFELHVQFGDDTCSAEFSLDLEEHSVSVEEALMNFDSRKPENFDPNTILGKYYDWVYSFIMSLCSIFDDLRY